MDITELHPLVVVLAVLGVFVLAAFVGYLLWRVFMPEANYLRREVTTLQTQLKEKDAHLAEATRQLHEAQRNEAVAEQRATLADAKDEELTSRNSEIQKLMNENTALNVRMEEERKSASEKLKLLEDARAKMSTEFENLAQRILDKKGGKLTEQNRLGMDRALAPLRQQLETFHKRVEDVYDKESKDRNALHGEIRRLQELNERIGQDALNLTNALKGKAKVRGNWGEMILERVLEISGLRRGHEYDVQQSFRDEQGNRMQPDVIVHLPDGKDIVIDSKLSLNAYERYCNATTDEERTTEMKQHVLSVQNHLRELGGKNYAGLKGLRTLDFVFMFLPVEAAFINVMESDQNLFREAFQHKIIMVSPSTLLAVLRTVANIWRTEQQNKNALEIARKAGGLYDKFVNFVAALEDVGVHLDKARDVHSTARKRLSEGSGNLIRRTEELRELGADARKSLPQDLLSEAGVRGAISHENNEDDTPSPARE